MYIRVSGTRANIFYTPQNYWSLNTVYTYVANRSRKVVQFNRLKIDTNFSKSVNSLLRWTEKRLEKFLIIIRYFLIISSNIQILFDSRRNRWFNLETTSTNRKEKYSRIKLGWVGGFFTTVTVIFSCIWPFLGHQLWNLIPLPRGEAIISPWLALKIIYSSHVFLELRCTTERIEAMSKHILTGT